LAGPGESLAAPAGKFEQGQRRRTSGSADDALEYLVNRRGGKHRRIHDTASRREPVLRRRCGAAGCLSELSRSLRQDRQLDPVTELALAVIEGLQASSAARLKGFPSSIL